MAHRWRNYDWADVQALARQPRFRDAPGERVCPVCGEKAVRSYLYGAHRGERPTLISYTWCASCHRYTSSTGPRPDGVTFTDPLEGLPSEARLRMSQDVIRLLDRLDAMWDAGELPQRFSTVK